MTFYFEPDVINKMKSLETYNKQDDISCVNGIIIRAIKEDADVEILYTNSVGINKVFHIRSIKFSSKYGNDYIVAFCDEACKELTFKIEQIKRANIIWNMVHSKNMKAPEDGMYLMACRGDMHLIYELYYYSKGSPFLSDSQMRMNIIIINLKLFLLHIILFLYTRRMIVLTGLPISIRTIF